MKEGQGLVGREDRVSGILPSVTPGSATSCLAILCLSFIISKLR